MNELEAVIRAWEKSAQPCVLATVVKTSGSTYRHAGARMLLGDDGWLAGGVSGGCLERDVLQKSWWHTSQGRPVVIDYDATADDEDVRWSLGLGCNGCTSVLLERVDHGARSGAMRFIRECLAGRERGVLSTVIAAPPGAQTQVGQRLMLDHAGAPVQPLQGADGIVFGDHALAAEIESDAWGALSTGASGHRSYRDGSIEIFHEVIAPPASLLVFGGGWDVIPLVDVAKLAGWHVTVIQEKAALAGRARFARADRVLAASAHGLAPLVGHVELESQAAAVVMNHNLARDRAALDFLLPSEVGYIGVLGPRHRTLRLLDDLGRPASLLDRGRLHAPVGLAIGAEGPHQIALAIAAEVQAFFAGKAVLRRVRGLVRAGKGSAPLPLDVMPADQPAVAAE
jgi:xanthine dehydrogenase accessory factor